MADKPVKTEKRASYSALQWLFGVFVMAGWIFLAAGLATGVRHLGVGNHTVGGWLILAGLFMTLVCYALAAMIKVLFDLAVQAGIAEQPKRG